MGKIAERAADIARRCGDLSPLAEPIRQRLWEGNKAVILAGVSPGSTARVAPLAESTLRRRKGNGPPRAPQGAGSRVVAGCVVTVRAGRGQLSFTKSYPSLGDIAEYLDRGTPRMPARPFMDFRPGDLEWVKAELRKHVVGGGVRGFFTNLFGG